jgi:POT family proton-dependent oligopeptide transporter
MALGLMLLGLGFVFMVVGAARSEGGQRVSPFWLTAAFAFHTAGELCLSPIGLSLVTKLAPARLASMMMGLWFLSTAFADWIAGLLAAYTERIARGEVFHLLGGQADFFFIFVVSSLAAGLGLAAMTPRLKRLMHGRDV